MSKDVFVIGADFGTDSVRTAIVHAADGKEISSAVAVYPRWSKGLFCDPAKNQFRQHPLDHLETLEKTIREALATAPAGSAELVRGISVDTTGSTPGPVNREGTPLALTKGFEENPDAMFVLWKDHTAVEEAAHINASREAGGG